MVLVQPLPPPSSGAWNEPVTSTGTLRLGFEVIDDQPFDFPPGQFVGIEAHFEGLGYRRSPYCILSPPDEDRRFEILVRVGPDGPLSQRLAELGPGDEVAFRGPNGRSMVPRFDDPALVLLATGTGVAPFCSLAYHLLDAGYTQPIDLWWGLRLVKEPFFAAGHRPHPEVVTQIRERFVATDLYSPYAARRNSQFDLDRDLEAARSGRAGNGDPRAASDLFELLPSFLSHHPDQENPAPTHGERPWKRPY